MSSTTPTLDPDAILETARILATAIPTDSLDGVRATLEYIHHADCEVSPETLQDIAPCDISDTDAENIVFQLAVEGIMNDTQLNVPALREVFFGARLVTAQKTPPENTVVATIPYDDHALDPNMFEPIHGNMLELIRSASDQLVLMSPFLSKRAYERLRPALHTAVANGASISLITNSLTYGDEDYNRDCAQAVLADDRLHDATRVYEYINDKTWMTFHAKIVVADSNQAYLGTANLTHRGLGDNLELGVIFRDSTVSRLSELVTTLKQSDFFYEIGLSGTRFYRL